MHRLSTALQTAAILLRKTAHYLILLSRMDVLEVERLHAFYHPQGDDRRFLAEIAASMTSALTDMADCLPRRMSPVARLSSFQHIQDLQDVMQDVKKREQESVERTMSEKDTKGAAPSARARDPHAFMGWAQMQTELPEAKHQRFAVWQAGMEGFGNMCRFAGFQRNQDQLVAVIAEMHALTDAVIQGLPWAKLDEDSTPPLAASDAAAQGDKASGTTV